MNTRALKQSIEDVLRQGLELLNEVGPEDYRRMLGAPYSASIGKHYRHVLDHFICLSRGLRDGVINYDERHRNTMLEEISEIARDATITLIEDLCSGDEFDSNDRCTVVYSVGYKDEEPLQIESTVAREISYCVSHAIHHFAIIRLACAEVGVGMREEFGVAPSTLKYRSAGA